MKRRTFLQSLLGATLTGAGIWTYTSDSALAQIFSSLLTIGSNRVANARPVPAFSVENFSATPSIRFLILGDWGAGGKLQKQIAHQMLLKAEKEHPGFVMSTGDNIYPGGVDSADDPQWQQKFESIYTGRALELPWYAVLGNHDYRHNPDAQIAYAKKNRHWNMPARYYKFSQTISPSASVEFFALDTQRIITGDRTATAEQVQWLDKELQQSQAQWKIVFGHHMVRSHGAYGDQAPMLQHIKPLLDKHNVDFYVNGHDHDLQYLKAQEDSFHCLISGGGGGSRNTAYGRNTIFAATNGGFAYMAIAADKLHLQFINPAGKILFADTIHKAG